MLKLLVIASFIVAFAMSFVSFPDGAVAAVLTVVLSLVVVKLIQHYQAENSTFLTGVFLVALIARTGLGIAIHLLELQSYFGGDAETYDAIGDILMRSWFGNPDQIEMEILGRRMSTVGWGMYYLVATIYSFTGRNFLAAQAFCAVIGAAIAPMVGICAGRIFNRRVGMFAAVLVALYPAFVVWTGQLLKDGIIIFLLVCSITIVLRLQERFSYPMLIMLLLSLGGILSLRSYIFYMVSVAIVGSFVISFAQSQRAMVASFLGLIILGTAFTYVGGLESTSRDIERFTDLEAVQRSRMDLSQRAESGFNEDVDVSTTRGALLAIPVGMVYLLLAPFPWQVANLRQLLALPDVLIWWAAIPFVISGIIFALRNRLRQTLGIIIFTSMLSLAYAIFQGNVGTAYRQRTQIQVFLFIFAATGITLLLERKENRIMLSRRHRENIAASRARV